jgi:predicted 2-oxoglutarate/Fe(II)-dependent dioxygenase YbiX
MECSVNIESNTSPVETMPHRDLNDFFFTMSCLIPFGEFEGGDLILWEAQIVVKLHAEDLFFFPAHLFTHSNTSVEGVRHSVIAFTSEGVLRWSAATTGYMNDRKNVVKKRQDEYRKNKKR